MRLFADLSRYGGGEDIVNCGAERGVEIRVALISGQSFGQCARETRDDPLVPGQTRVRLFSRVATMRMTLGWSING